MLWKALKTRVDAGSHHVDVKACSATMHASRLKGHPVENETREIAIIHASTSRPSLLNAGTLDSFPFCLDHARNNSDDGSKPGMLAIWSWHTTTLLRTGSCGTRRYDLEMPCKEHRSHMRIPGSLLTTSLLHLINLTRNESFPPMSEPL